MATTVEANSTEVIAAPKGSAPWYRDRQRLVMAGGIGLALAAAAAYFVKESGERKEQFAAQSLGRAQMAIEQNNLPLASSELQKLVTTYHGTSAAAEAVVVLNQIRLNNGQGELAAASLREFIAGKPAPEYAVPASSLLGAALESGKHWGDAGDAYTKAAEQVQQDYLKVAYLISAGRAYRTGGLKDKAVAAYRTVIEKHSAAPNVVEAQIRLAELTAGQQGTLPDSAATKAGAK